MNCTSKFDHCVQKKKSHCQCAKHHYVRPSFTVSRLSRRNFSWSSHYSKCLPGYWMVFSAGGATMSVFLLDTSHHRVFCHPHHLASPRILQLPDVFLLSNKIRGDARWCEVMCHKVTYQVACALPYGNVNNQDSAHPPDRDTKWIMTSTMSHCWVRTL